MERLRIIATGNCLRKVSYSAWDDCDSLRQETVCEKFLIRHVTIAYNRGRKLFAKGFLFGM